METGRIAIAGGRPVRSPLTQSFDRICQVVPSASSHAHLIYDSLGPPLSPLSRFCMADASSFYTLHCSTPYVIQNCPPWGDLDPYLMHCSLEPAYPPPPNGISIDLAVFFQNSRSFPRDRQTDRQNDDGVQPVTTDRLVYATKRHA